MMDFLLKTMDLLLEMMDFVVKMMDFVVKMMDFIGTRLHQRSREGFPALAYGHARAGALYTNLRSINRAACISILI